MLRYIQNDLKYQNNGFGFTIFVVSNKNISYSEHPFYFLTIKLLILI